VLDEGHYESLLFLTHVFSKFAKPESIYILTHQPVFTNFKVVDFNNVSSLSDLSIKVAELRKQVGEGILIHHYLPYVLINYEEKLILKLLEHLASQIQGMPFIDFFTLPRGTYLMFEKKAQALLHGTILLSHGNVNGNYLPKFSILKACKPEFYAKEFPYTIRNNRLLILFDGEFIDKLPESLEEKILSKKMFLNENFRSLKVVMRGDAIEKLNPIDYFLLTQLHNMRLTDAKLLFYDKFDEISEKLARWAVLGGVEFEKVNEVEEAEVKRGMKKISKLAFAMPSFISSKLLGGDPRRVPVESLLALRKSIEIVLKTYLPNTREPTETFIATEKMIHELAARITAIERLKKYGENPWVRIDFDYLPKAAALTLYVGFGLKCKIVNKTDKGFEVVMKDCFECEGTSSEKPVCNMISGTLQGTLCQVSKHAIRCDEIRCKAIGDSECALLVRKIQA